MQTHVTEAIRTQSQPSKPKREINKTTKIVKNKENMVNRVSSSFPKGGHSDTKLN